MTIADALREIANAVLDGTASPAETGCALYRLAARAEQRDAAIEALPDSVACAILSEVD